MLHLLDGTCGSVTILKTFEMRKCRGISIYHICERIPTDRVLQNEKSMSDSMSQSPLEKSGITNELFYKQKLSDPPHHLLLS
jgi:hypothetical protein